MKKLLPLLSFIILATGCSQEREGLEALLIEKMREDKDQRDYNLKPEEMASCVLDKIDRQIPGFTIGSNRDGYYTAYVRYLNAKGSKEMVTVLQDSGIVFGSEQRARATLLSMSDHVIDCMGELLAENTEGHG